MHTIRQNLKMHQSTDDHGKGLTFESAFLQPLFDRLAARDHDVGGLPFVTLSYAQSVDGSIAARPSRPFALSSDKSFEMTHLLRARHDALLVGINTVLVDDPRLTVRHCAGDNPRPVVLDSRLRFPGDARLLTHPDQHPLLFTTTAAHADHVARMEARGVSVRTLPKDALGRVDLVAALECLAGLGVRRLMVEGGACVINSFLQCRLVDYCVITVVPKLIGGVKAVDRLGPSDDVLPLSIVDCRYQPLGGDLIIHGTIGKGDRACAPTP
jgi:3,4-dihydroxy 2-butanone 4-phosphate synthase/GTP cyclohydrolase II